MKATNKKTGFTLIELLVVVAIISLLSSVVLSSLQTARTKAADAKIMSEYNQLRTAMELYYNDNGYYPTPPSPATYCISATCKLAGNTFPALKDNTYPSFTYTPSDYTLDADNGGFLYFIASPGQVIFGTNQGGIVHATTGEWVLSTGSN